jgi:hypothetical protein
MKDGKVPVRRMTYKREIKKAQFAQRVISQIMPVASAELLVCICEVCGKPLKRCGL